MQTTHCQDLNLQCTVPKIYSALPIVNQRIHEGAPETLFKCHACQSPRLLRLIWMLRLSLGMTELNLMRELIWYTVMTECMQMTIRSIPSCLQEGCGDCRSYKVTTTNRNTNANQFYFKFSPSGWGLWEKLLQLD